MHPSILESAARSTQVRFPWIPHKNEPPGHRSYRCPPLGNHTTMNHTILVIHDDPAALARIGARLERGGHDVRRARSAAEARRVILEEDPGIILTPVCLSDLPAERPAEHFRSLRKDIGVILLAQGSEVDEAASMLDRSADDFVITPMEEARLVTAVDHVLERQELQSRLEDRHTTISTSAPSTSFVQPGEILHFAHYEREILLHALLTTGWNVKETATRLKIGRATLYRKIERYDLRTYRHRDAG